MKWQLLADRQAESPEELAQILLTNRQIQDTEQFFNPTHPKDLSLAELDINPKMIEQALALIEVAKQQDHTVLVFGDYDADGISAVTVLCRSLMISGCKKVIPFIPDRHKHGYGLSQKALEDILAQDEPDLVITVDNGIVAHDPVAWLIEKGIKVIVTDHHAPEVDANGLDLLPPADAVVHTTKLCGTTVAWILGRELEKASTKSVEQSLRGLDLCGLATIADQVKLVDANRSFAWWGLKALRATQRPGIKAMAELAKLNQAEMSVENVNYVLCPRINAMGRLEQGQQAFELLWTGSMAKAKSLAPAISETNLRRQSLTQEMLDDARSQAKSWQNEHLILVHSTEYHEGVIGLIAGRLVEEFHKPAIVLAVKDTFAKASARSIEGINIIELIREVRQDLLEVGGHPGAAGFSVLPEKISIIHEKLLVLAKQQITPEALRAKLSVECWLAPSLTEMPVAMEVISCLKQFEPCGQGNPRPVLGLKNMKILDWQTMGDEGQHLKLIVASDNSVQPLTCLGWGLGRQTTGIRSQQLVDLAGILEINTWKNRQNLQLVIKDIVPTA